jgi:signal transduction histidine kinase
MPDSGRDHSTPAFSASVLAKAVEAHTAPLQATVNALETARERLERAQAMANLGDLELDVGSGERVWSTQLCRLFGFDPAQGTPTFEQALARVHAEDLPRMRGVVVDALGGRGWPSTDARIVLPDGAVRWLRSAGEYSEQAGRRKMNVIMHDVTALKTAERELLANLERERELAQLRADFMNMVTHEYRTPLGIIMSSVEILERYFGRLSTEDRAAHLAEIRTGARRLADLVEDVLFLGKADAGHVALELRSLDLEAVLKKLVAEVTTALGAERIVNVDIERSAQRVRLDQRLLTHVVTNVLSNALKYSTLDTAVNVRARREKNALEIAIEDRGIGIPAADQQKLFQVFQRASNVGTISGSGLGLAIVKRCLDLHGGSILLKSEVSRGTIVTVRFPQAPAKASAKNTPSSHETNPNSRRGRRTSHATKPRHDPENGKVRSVRSRGR